MNKYFNNISIFLFQLQQNYDPKQPTLALNDLLHFAIPLNS